MINETYLKCILPADCENIWNLSRKYSNTNDYENMFNLLSSIIDHNDHNENLKTNHKYDEVTILQPNCMSDHEYIFTIERNVKLEINEVNVDQLLGLTKKVGIKCKSCGESEVSYKLFANRSADEGMSAYCSCRLCGCQWTITM